MATTDHTPTDDEFNPYTGRNDRNGERPEEDRVKESRRPALVKLTEDIRGLEAELFAGFGSRREILEWSQRLAVRTLGELPQQWFKEMARQFRGVPKSAEERVLLSALLQEDARTRDLDESKCRELRRQLSANNIRPAAHRAFRNLRKDAGEYVDNDDSAGTQHNPERQRYVAMRPSIDELERDQQQALRDLLGGFDNREEILSWGHDLELATHGEIGEMFVTNCYQEKPTRRMLTSERPSDARGRELFAAHYVLPVFNRGIRDLAGRAKELPDAEHEKSEVTKL